MLEESKLRLPKCFSTASQTLLARNMAAMQNEAPDSEFPAGNKAPAMQEATPAHISKTTHIPRGKIALGLLVWEMQLYASWDNSLESDKNSQWENK